MTSHSRWPVNGSVAAWPMRSVADCFPPCASPAASPSVGGLPGSDCGCFCSPGLVLDGVVVTPVVVVIGGAGSGDCFGSGTCFGSGNGFGSGVGVGPGSGRGCGTGPPPQLPER